MSRWKLRKNYMYLIFPAKIPFTFWVFVTQSYPTWAAENIQALDLTSPLPPPYTNTHTLFCVWRCTGSLRLALLSTPTGVDCVDGRSLCSNWFWHGSAAISFSQCSLTVMREGYLHSCREQPFAIRAYAMSAVVSTVRIDAVSSHLKYCRIAYVITI